MSSPYVKPPTEMAGPLDEEADMHTAMNCNLLVPWLLMAALAYDESDPILSDAMFDKLARTMARDYAIVEHQHKHLIPAPEEGAATVHIMLAHSQYPSRVHGALHHVRMFGKSFVDISDEPDTVAP